jgi:hypothetical protein
MIASARMDHMVARVVGKVGSMMVQAMEQAGALQVTHRCHRAGANLLSTTQRKMAVVNSRTPLTAQPQRAANHNPQRWCLLQRPLLLLWCLLLG